MGIVRGSNIITDGLIYGYDTGYGVADKHTSTRFYKGRPTTNEINLTTSDLNNWTSYSNGNDGTFTTEFGTVGVKINNRASWNGLYKNFALPSTGTYTFSAWFRYRGGTSNNNGATVYISGWGGSDTQTTIDKSKVGEWQRISRTINVTDVTLSFYLISYGGSQSSDTSSWDVTMPQIEKLSDATPFVNGSRSNTTSLIDLKRTRNISVANMSFDSTGQPTIDGTDDKISTGVTTQLDDFSCVVVFKNDNSATWGRIVDKSYTTGFFISPRWNGNAGHVGAGIIEPNAPHGQHLSYDNTKYNYFAVTRNGGTHTIYLNGASNSTSKTNGSTSLLSSTEMHIGSWYDNRSSQRFTGEIPVFKLYNKQLSATEIQQDFEAYKNRFNL